MKILRNWLAKKSHVARRPLSFETAFCLSLFTHFVMFVAAACLVSALAEFDSDTPPLVFDFVFTPSQQQDNEEKKPRLNLNHATDQSSSQLQTEEKEPQSLTLSSEAMELNSAPDEALPVTQKNQPISAAMESDAERLHNQEMQIASHSEVEREEIESPPRVATVALAKPELVPAKLPIPNQHRKAILQRVKKLLAKPILPAAFDSSFTWEKNGRRFHFQVSHQPAKSATGLDELFITVATNEGGDTLTTRLRMQRLAFSSFAQFVDYWDPHVAVHDDEFDGRFHSNSAILISGSRGTQPKFRGKVTTADYTINNRDTGPFLNLREVFLNGIETGADYIPLPRAFLGISDENGHTLGQVNSFTEETWITFHRDGSYTWRTASTPRERRVTLSDEPSCLLGKGKAKLHIAGVVKGRVIVFCENKILIDGDLLYAQDPEIVSGADDFLGLVSAKDIEIAPPAVTGFGDLRIFAAILAKGCFRVTHLYTRETGTLHIYGSLAAGAITATEPRYATHVRFDKRFDKIRPPYFPVTNRYEITEWDERWSVK